MDPADSGKKHRWSSAHGRLLRRDVFEEECDFDSEMSYLSHNVNDHETFDLNLTMSERERTTSVVAQGV